MAVIKGLTIELDMNSTGVSQSFKGLKRDINETSKLSKVLDKSLKLDPKNLDNWKRKQNTLNLELRETSQQLNNLRSEKKVLENNRDVADWDNKMKKLNTTIQQTENKMTSLDRAVAKTNREMQKVALSQTALGKASIGMGKASKTLDTYASKMRSASVASGLLLGAIGKVGFEFDDAFAGVKKTVNASDEELNRLKHSIISMTTEIPKSASEISQAMELGGQLGIQNKYLEGFTKTMVNLDVATNMTTEDAATMAAQFANITKMDQSNFDRFGSTIVALGNNSATTEKDVMEMAMRLAAAGKQAGLTQEQILGVSATMTSLGINAEAGGTAFSKFLVKMESAVNKGGKELNTFTKAVGLNAKEFSNTWKKEPTEAIQMFFNAMNKSSKAGKPMFKMLDELDISEARMADTIKRMASNPELLAKSLNISSTAWKENTALTEEATRKYETFISKLKLLGNKVKATLLKAFEKMEPQLNAVIDGMSKGLDSLSNVIDGMSPEALFAVASGLTAITVAYPMLLATSKGLGLLSKSFGVLNTVVNGKKIAETATATAQVGAATATSSSKVSTFAASLKSIGTGFVSLGPAGWVAAAGIAAFGLAVYNSNKKQKEATKNMGDLSAKLDEVHQKYAGFKGTVSDESDLKSNEKRIDALTKVASKQELTEQQQKEFFDRLAATTAAGLEKVEQEYEKSKLAAGDNISLINKADADYARKAAVEYDKMTDAIQSMNKVKLENLTMNKNGYIVVDPNKTKEEQEAIRQMNDALKTLPETARQEYMKMQSGLTAASDGKWFKNGKDVSQQMALGISAGLAGTVGELLTGFGDGLVAEKDKLLYAGQEINASLFKGLSKDEVLAKAQGIKAGIDAGLTANGDEFVIAGQKITADFFTGMNPAQVQANINGINAGIKAGLTFADGYFTISGQQVAGDFFAGLNQEQVTARMATIKSLIANGMTFQNGEMIYKGQQISGDLFTGMSNADMSSSLSIIKRMIDSGLDFDLSPQATKAMSTYKTALEKVNFSQPKAKVVKDLKGIKADLSPEGKKAMDSLIKGIESGSKNSKGAADKAVKQVKTPFKNSKTMLSSEGRFITVGLSQGIRDGFPELDRTINELAQKAEKAVREKAKIKSPSRVMMELGGFITQGLAIGILDDIKYVENAAVKLIKTINSAVANSQLENIMGENKIKIFEEMKKQQLSQDGLGDKEKAEIIKYWDERIAEETKQYKRLVEALKREEEWKRKDDEHQRKIDAAQKKKDAADRKIQEAKDKLKSKKLSKKDRKKYKNILKNNKKISDSQQKLINNENQQKLKDEQIYKINDGIAKSKEEAVDLANQMNKQLNEQVDSSSATSNNYDAMNKALEKILGYDIFERIASTVGDIKNSINTSGMNSAINQATSNDNRQINITINTGSNVNEKELAKILNEELMLI